MKYADLHCDTLTAAYSRAESLRYSSTDISLDKAACFDGYIQVAAVFTSPSLSDDDGFKRFLDVSDYAYNEQKLNSAKMAICKSGDDIERALSSGKASFILSVEDARILSGDISRLIILRERGVRIITPLWSGNTCIGGSFDTDCGLTDFGRDAIKECFDLSIIPDISHASRESADEILTLAEKLGKPVIASHSDSFAVCPHRRNLTDDQFRRIYDLGGLVGINLYPIHVANRKSCSAKDIFAHIEHWLSLGIAESTLCFGGDLDGIECRPDCVSSIADIPSLFSELRSFGIDDNTLSGIAYENAHRFLKDNIK